MEKNVQLLKDISIIHAIKCNKTVIWNEAIDSFNTLTQLQKMIVNNANLDCIEYEIEQWKTIEPKISDNELCNLRKLQ